MADEVLFALDKRGVATLTLNQRKTLNAFDAAQIAAFNHAMARAVASPGLRVIVIAGAGPIFCSGADIRYLQGTGTLTPAKNLADARLYAAMAEAMRDAPVPVVGRVHGGAYGGGLAIAAACDIVLAAQSTKFAITEARYGLTPSLMVPFLIGRIGQRGMRGGRQKQGGDCHRQTRGKTAHGIPPSRTRLRPNHDSITPKTDHKACDKLSSSYWAAPAD